MMKDHFSEQIKELFDFLPVTFHIVNLEDHEWPKF